MLKECRKGMGNGYSSTEGSRNDGKGQRAVIWGIRDDDRKQIILTDIFRESGELCGY
jgi:hypothetical protein